MNAPPQSRRWIWFFVVLVLLALAGATINFVFNLRQQLTREDLEGAMSRWQADGPRSYNFRYLVKKLESEPETYYAEVRNGRVVRASVNGRLLQSDLWHYHDMEHRFSDIQGFLDEDAKPGKPRVFVIGQFDAKDGRLIRYVRSVTATRQRVEIDVLEVTAVSESAPGAIARP